MLEWFNFEVGDRIMKIQLILELDLTNNYLDTELSNEEMMRDATRFFEIKNVFPNRYNSTNLTNIVVSSIKEME